LISITGAIIFASLLLLIFVNQPQYTILFSDLSSTDAASVRDQLQDDKVPYKLRDGGSTILVPKDKVYDMRLILAASGIPTQAGVGYEIFDRTNLGMSDFVQRLNFKRALEGELSRTISGIAEVDQARVHVVIPEQALFREDEKETTASVVLKLKSRARLSEDSIRGISILVSRSVEGLEAENVIILDSYGNLLSGGQQPDPGLGLSSTQLELQHKVENHLALKAQTMLDGVLGPGKSIVRVNAELDFKTIERTREIYDPESAVVRSEERTESELTGGSAPSSKEENSLSNYEINKTVEHLMNSGGSIIRLSVAVIVDGHYEADEEGNMVYTPRSDEEITSISNMMRGALGLRDDREDNFQITSIAFERETFTEDVESWKTAEYQDIIITILPKLILGIVLLMLLMMIKGFLKKHLAVTKAVLDSGPHISMPQMTGSPAQLMPAGAAQIAPKKATTAKVMLPDMEDSVTVEVREAQAMKEQVTNFAETKPEAATMLIRSWILNSGDKK